MAPEPNSAEVPGAPRVELRRFLGGIPFSHVRTITPQERKQLLFDLAPYGLVTLAVLGLFCWTTTLWGLSNLLSGLVVVAGGFLLSIPAYFAFRAWPKIQTLRTGNVFVYLGPMRDIANFDVVQSYFQRNHPLSEHLNRHIEILALGNGDRIWRLEGIPVSGGALQGVHAIRLALLPDFDERGERRLTAEEAEELRLRISDYKDFGAFLLRTFFVAIFTTQAFKLVGASVSLPVAAQAAIYLSAMGVAWNPYWNRRRFANLLREDLHAGIVREGALASGLPWVVQGEPAQWRVGIARGGTSAISKEQAMALEEGIRAEEEGGEEELLRQALASTLPFPEEREGARTLKRD